MKLYVALSKDKIYHHVSLLGIFLTYNQAYEACAKDLKENKSSESLLDYFIGRKKVTLF